ncbi:uncharacterized protein [Diadema antillarum]|uniref:uncharacterized protein n=1 Tax=Diadema antillarum TaxID=105358 RepID=UPI003A846BA7
MEERIWYILLCFISNSQILLPTLSLSTSLRDDSSLLHPMSGRAMLDSTVRKHEVHRRSVDCPEEYYEPQSPGASRSKRSTEVEWTIGDLLRRHRHRGDHDHDHHPPWSIVGRSGHRTRTGGTNKTPTDQLPYVGICVPCSKCSQGEFEAEPCTSTSNTVCRQCNSAAGTSCTSLYNENVDLAMTTPPRLKDDKSSPVKVTVDLSGNVAPSKPNRKPTPEDVNVNIQKAGRDERNSWYFLSLCALIGLLVFLSLVMGAYLVSVKVTSWWRYQRPVTVRRRGQSFHEETTNQIEFSMTSMPPLRYDDIPLRNGSQPTASRPSEKTIPISGEGLRPASDPTVVDESFPSTSGYGSKIHVVRLKNTHMDVDKVSSLDSFVLDARGIAKHRFANQYYPKGFSWSGGVNYDDSSVYSSEDDDDIGTGSLPSRSSPVLQTVYAGKGGRCYGRPSDPVRDQCTKDEVHLVQWPHLMRSNQLYYAGGRVSHDFQNTSSPVFTRGAEPKSEYFAMATDEKDCDCISRPVADPLLAQPERRYNTSCVSCAADIEVSYMPLPCQTLASNYDDHADPHGFLRRHHDNASMDTLPRNFSKVCEHRHSLPLQRTDADDLYFNAGDHPLTNLQLGLHHQPSEITNLGHSTPAQQSGKEEEADSDCELSVHSPLLDKNIHDSSELQNGGSSPHLPHCKPPANQINDTEHDGRGILEETV